MRNKIFSFILILLLLLSVTGLTACAELPEGWEGHKLKLEGNRLRTLWYEVESIEKGFASECEELVKHPFNPDQARKKRIEAIKHHTQYLRCEFEQPNYLKAVKAKHAKELDIEVPLDPRFID